MRDRLNRGRNFEAAKIGAAKNIAGVGRRRQQTQIDGDACVQPDAANFDRLRDRSLFRTRKIHGD